jgi:hypothetical protein
MTPAATVVVAVALITASASTGARAQWYQGPSGGTGGQSFDGWVLNNHSTNIRTVNIQLSKYKNVLHCVVANYPTKPDDPLSGLSGSSGPDNCNVDDKSDSILNFSMDSNEYILGISGTYTDHVTSLRFYTNKKNSPIYGEGPSGTVFGYTAPIGQMIVAFTQANDSQLRSIGVMYAPCDSKTKACK